ncbi:hypothetical protein [Naasia aerilata]|uniref:DUF4352 domain-containing protein n=1 Tax=Naasia aerilata TaxID=1162966 RepID=A0ABN6XLT6_9MICO|nr:hypothetical protein [Naasia aerilata]BDZ45937.1 hypothetical protein GCM10025866_18460 [Naasia aerilata]
MTTDETPDPTDPKRRRTRLILGVLGGIVVLALLAVGIWAVASPKSPTPGASGSPSASSSPSPSASASATPTPEPTGTITPTAPPPSDAPDPALDSDDTIDVGYQDQPVAAAGLVIRVSALDAVQGNADEPGEIAGPSLRFVVEFVNNTGAAISLRDVAINVDYGADKTPAVELNESDTSPVPGEVAANSTVSGTYTFNVPTDGRDQVRLTVFTTVDDPVIAFSGPAPR